jgi:kynureninase
MRNAERIPHERSTVLVMRSLTAYRPEFPILDRTVYMISNSLGAMPRAVAESLAEYADTWATRGVRAWGERWWAMNRETGDAVGRIIGAPAGSVSMHENVTTAHAVVLSTLPLPGRRTQLVCCSGDFPSTLYLCRAQQALGFELVVVPAERGCTIDESRLVEAIGERTALVLISHVLFRSSWVIDPRPIVERAHAVGARVVLDTYQSAGIVPLDVTSLGVDFATGGCLKWLCGGPGNAFLYTRPDLLAELRPRLTGWFAHPNPFAFDVDTEAFEPPADARRMLSGTPAIPAWYAALPGLRIIDEVGVGRIRERSHALTQRLLDHVDAHGFSTVASRTPERLGGTVAVDVPDALAVARTLNARDVVVDYRPGVGIRISPHFYNTDEDVDATMAEIARIVRTKDYVTAKEETTS